MPRAERRLPSRLLRLWQEACRGRLMPSPGDIGEKEVGEAWSKCVLLDVATMAYTHLGQDIIDAAGASGMEQGSAVVISPDASRLVLHFEQVITSAAPVLSEGEFLGPGGRRVRYRQCLLPLGEAETVRAVVGGVNFRCV